MIAAFVADKMNAYTAGGMKPETAARFTRGELSAIYKCNHYNRDASGAMRVTPPPEALGIDEAMRKTDAAINEILRTCVDMAKGKNRSCTAPENVPKATPSLEGFEKLNEYAKRTTA